jgi:hypothetical protein
MKYNFTVTEEVEYKHAQISGMTAQYLQKKNELQI